MPIPIPHGAIKLKFKINKDVIPDRQVLIFKTVPQQLIISESEKNPFLYPDFSYGNSWNKTYISTIHLCSFNSDVCIEEPIFISTPE